jgi:hypothetical protein
MQNIMTRTFVTREQYEAPRVPLHFKPLRRASRALASKRNAATASMERLAARVLMSATVLLWGIVIFSFYQTA